MRSTKKQYSRCCDYILTAAKRYVDAEQVTKLKNLLHDVQADSPLSNLGEVTWWLHGKGVPGSDQDDPFSMHMLWSKTPYTRLHLRIGYGENRMQLSIGCTTTDASTIQVGTYTTEDLTAFRHALTAALWLVLKR